MSERTYEDRHDWFNAIYDAVFFIVKDREGMIAKLNSSVQTGGYEGFGRFVEDLHDTARMTFLDRVWKILSEPYWFMSLRCIRELRAAHAEFDKVYYVHRKWKRFVYLNEIGVLVTRPR